MTDPTKPRAARTQRLDRASAPTTRETRGEQLRHVAATIASSSSSSGGPVTSLDFASRHPVKPDLYRSEERHAAQEAVALAKDYGLNRDAMDALSFVAATGWPGFQTLAMLAQLPEYRSMHETLADETVRTWGEIQSSSEDEQADDKLEKIREEFERLKVRDLVRTAVIHDQAYGGAHVLPRIEDRSGSPLPSDAPLLLSKAFVAKGSLKALTTVEPLWVSPAAYNANDPTAPDFYSPRSWMLLGMQVDATRLHTVISRPVSDLLKPTYSFRGVSMSQLAMPYVDNWLRTRQSVSDTVKQFSVTYLSADLSQMLAPGGAYSMLDRLQLFNLNRDNRNVALIDKETEEFGQVNTPLSGLDALQAQAQEQMSAVSHIPLVKLLGITPAGLNANSDGEIRVWYDYVAGYQAHNLTPLMHWILQLVQLSLFGEIDPALRWDWAPLFELNELELADVRHKNAETELRYMEAGVLSGEMVQKRLQLDPKSGFSGILAEVDPEEEAEALAARMLEGKEEPASADPAQAEDGWNETDHPRDPDGQFASGSAAAVKPKRAKAAVKVREGQQPVAKPFAVEKDDWGDYVGGGLFGSIPKQHVTVKGGLVVGMTPALAKSTNTELMGEVTGPSEKTLAKQAEAEAEAARVAAEKSAAAKIGVFQITVANRLRKVPEADRPAARAELSAALSAEGTPLERVERAEAVLKRFGG